jgi:hypothetical protein
MLCRPCNSQVGKHESGRSRTWCEVIALYLADPPANGAGWIWDACGSVGSFMRARARASGHLGGISCFAPAEVLRWPAGSHLRSPAGKNDHDGREGAVMAHDGHSLHPHAHVIEGLPKPCAGRWWCQGCREWFTRRPCAVAGAPKLPASWLKP